jgi:hypothetical protein
MAKPTTKTPTTNTLTLREFILDHARREMVMAPLPDDDDDVNYSDVSVVSQSVSVGAASSVMSSTSYGMTMLASSPPRPTPSNQIMTASSMTSWGQPFGGGPSPTPNNKHVTKSTWKKILEIITDP